jgi:hypothetical protein
MVTHWLSTVKKSKITIVNFPRKEYLERKEDRRSLSVPETGLGTRVLNTSSGTEGGA